MEAPVLHAQLVQELKHGAHAPVRELISSRLESSQGHACAHIVSLRCHHLAILDVIENSVPACLLILCLTRHERGHSPTLEAILVFQEFGHENFVCTFVGEPKGSAPSPLSVCQNATLKRSLRTHASSQGAPMASNRKAHHNFLYWQTLTTPSWACP